jgi:hypothetical protein
MKIVGLRLLLSVVSSFSMISATAFAARDFSYDGCSLFPEGTIKEPKLWDHCCLEHDLFYWAGGTKKQRLSADRGLRQCLRDLGKKKLANLVYAAVRAGRLYPFKFRGQQWGNAWSLKRNYNCPTEIKYYEIALKLEDYDLPLRLEDKVLQSLEAAINNPEKKCLEAASLQPAQ